MFNKVNDYNKITIVTYPDGNVKNTTKNSFDFDNGARVVEKYKKESEKFKKKSIDVQSDTSENDTLKDDTLKMTVEVLDYAFSFVSAAGYPNIAFAKAIGRMTKEQLESLKAKYDKFGFEEYPTMVEFQEFINEICDDETLDVAFKAHVHIYDSYTKEHIEAIRYIINSMTDDVEDKGNELVVSSADPDIKNAIIDLGMSKYYDIDIEE